MTATTSVFTIGHSTRDLDELLDLLGAYQIARLVDVRSVPRSRKNPQFNRDTLPAALAAHGIDYHHAAGLGGLRKTRADSPNSAWRNASFRGYADYMQTPEFGENLAWLVAQAADQRLALMCAEALPWRCHRSLIADALYARDIPARHIMSEKRADLHKPTSFARFDGSRVDYPGPA